MRSLIRIPDAVTFIFVYTFGQRFVEHSRRAGTDKARSLWEDGAARSVRDHLHTISQYIR